MASRLVPGPALRSALAAPRPQLVTKRNLEILLAVLFLIMCGLIAYGQWYAIHVNVPHYQHAGGR